MLRLNMGVQAAFGGTSSASASLPRMGRESRYLLLRQRSVAAGPFHSASSSGATKRMRSERFQSSEHFFFDRHIHQLSTPRFSSTSLPCIKKNSRSDENITSKNDHEEQVAEVLCQVEQSLCEVILPQIHSNTAGTDKTEVCDSANTPTILLVAVSGGCDSMGLLHALLDTSNPVAEPAPTASKETSNGHHNIRRFPNGQLCELHVAHFDHCQRGIESQKDSQLVQDSCQQQGLPCHVYLWDDEIGSTTTSKFSQDKARQWRQSTLTQLLHDLTVSVSTSSSATAHQSSPIRRDGLILTAHHANDSQETLLLKLLRGVHIQNLSGMAKLHYMDATKVFWARPLLDITKDQIQFYLEVKGYVWREDASNQSNKYLRNRVRNELIPLMQDLVGGEAVLQKRLENLEEQCSEIRTDLSSRANLVSEQHVDREGRFLFPANEDNISDLAVREALYKWASQATIKHQLSYDVWKRVLAQLTEYPNNRQWTLPLGEGWYVQRVGDALQIYKDAAMVDNSTRGTKDSNPDPPPQLTSHGAESIPWSFVDGTIIAQTFAASLLVRLHSDLNAHLINYRFSTIEFVLSSAGGGVSHANSWKITPPWREGQSPVKLGSFLRGQKVPLHLRDSTPIVVCEYQQRGNNQVGSLLVAVLVNEKWVVDAAWNIADASKEGNSESSSILLRLDK